MGHGVKHYGWLLVGAVLLLSACSGDKGDKAAGRKGGERQHLVELVAVGRDVLSYTAARAGSLRAVREVKLVNQEEGRIKALNAREGDSVQRGDVLLQLDDRILRAELAKANAELRQAKLDVNRLQQLKAKQLVSEDALTRAGTTLEVARAEARLLRTRLDFMRITAPFDGQIAERFVDTGDVAPKNSHVLTLIDSSELVTDLQVSELILPTIKVGDSVELRIDALGDQVFEGAILRIYPKIDVNTRLGRIEVSLKPAPPGARAGQFCRVAFSGSQQDRLVIPFPALRRDAQGEFVYVYGNDTKVRRTAVKSGLRLTDKVEILDGLTVGQQVVAKGFLGLNDGQTVIPVSDTPQPASRQGLGRAAGA